jgi:hypothetical protein
VRRLAVALVAVVAALAAAGAARASGPGTLVDYGEATANVSVTSTAEATATPVVAAAGFTADGTSKYLVSFFASVVHPASTGTIKVVLYDGSISSAHDLGWLANQNTPTNVAVEATRVVTPSAGTHTYTVGAFESGGTATVGAGAGGSGTSLPAYVSVTQLTGSEVDDDSAYCTGLTGPCADTDTGGGGGCTTLDCLSDVSTTSSSAGQVLTYEAASATWTNADTCGSDVADPCTVDVATTGTTAGFLNNLHDDLFVLIGAVIGAALIPLILRWFTAGRD